jgi:hypothetical protein
MLLLRDRCAQRERPAFVAGLLGGFLGAALLLGVTMLAGAPGSPGVPGPRAALADTTAPDEPRGLISAADQRKQILERLDRIVILLERLNADTRTSTR